MILEELKKLIKIFLYWSLFFMVLTLISIIPIIKEQSLVVLVFDFVSKNLMPEGVSFIVTNPISAFVSHIIIGLSLSFILLLPFFMYGLILYIKPALNKRERKNITKVILPSFTLFILGALFAYYFVIPITFKTLYSFAVSLGAEQYFLVNEFIYFVFGMMFMTGILFLLPVFMSLLTFFKIISSNFWLEKWRFALVSTLIFTAIITPDGTGTTMILLSIPLVALYVLGCIITRKIDYK